MRGSFGLLRNGNGVIGSKRVIGEAVKHVSFSTFSGSGGGGRGRGRGTFMPNQYDFLGGSISSPGEVDSSSGLNEPEKPIPSVGVGLGRGKPLPSVDTFVAGSNSDPGEVDSATALNEPEKPKPSVGVGLGRGKPLPSFNTFVAPNQVGQQPEVGRGRGGVSTQRNEQGNEGESRADGPVVHRKDEGTVGQPFDDESVGLGSSQPIGEIKLSVGIMNVLMGSGRGRGMTDKMPVCDDSDRPKVENRHARPRRGGGPGPYSGDGRGEDRVESKEATSEPKKPKLSREEAVRKAVGILSSKEVGSEEGGGGRGRGRGRGWGRGRGFRRGDEDEDKDDNSGLFTGDDADGERLAEMLGPARMAELTEAFEDLSTEFLPDPAHDEYLHALDTNCKHEFEPEYLFGDFETNPDINENPPIPLRDALEKMKPFLMASEGIKNQEEWEEAVKGTMENVPLLKGVVDHYCGPDRVTAKQQREELERVAKKLPESVPDALTRFTDRAILSLQSNPGWGFNRKCQFMDKLVGEFSKPYK